MCPLGGWSYSSGLKQCSSGEWRRVAGDWAVPLGPSWALTSS